MTTQEIQNIKLDDYQVSKMMLGNYQVWPFNEIDYGPEVPEIEGDYLAFATYGEADISFTTWGITYGTTTTTVWIDDIKLDGCIVNFQPDVIYSFDGQIWNDLSWQEKEDKTGYNFETIHITQEKPVYIKRKDPSIPIHSFLQFIRGAYRDGLCPFSFTMLGDEVYCSGKLKAWLNIEEFKKERLTRIQNGVNNLAVLPTFLGLFMGCKQLKIANIDFDEIINNTGYAEMAFSDMFNSCSSLVVGPTLKISKTSPYNFRNMFYGCSSLIKTNCSINLMTLPIDETFYSMYEGCSSLIIGPQNIVIDNVNANRFIYSDVFYHTFKDCRLLVNAPSIILKSNVDIDISGVSQQPFRGCFSGCDSITHFNLNMPENIEIDAGLYMNMLSGCPNLKYIKFGKVTSKNIYAYYECFRWLTISNYSENGLIEIDKDSYSDVEKELFKIPNNGPLPPQGWKIVRV